MADLNPPTSRREFIKKLSIGTSAVYMSTLINACARSADAIPSAINDEIDLDLRLIATPDKVQILPGNATNVWRYQGELLKGPQGSLESLPDSYLGPIIHLARGQHVRVRFLNDLPEPSIIHWHGLHVPESADGHPRLAVQPGEEYIYEFTVMDRAGTYWFHPHPHGRTGPQVYLGLAGLIIIHDEEESTLELPGGNQDIPIIIQDRTFDEQNQLVYGGTSMDQMMGFLGNTLLVNGQTQKVVPVETRAYRLRILNGSNSRIYKLAWSDGSLITVIGTDGGLLEKPLPRRFVTLAPAQRLEVWADFSSRQVGSHLQLVNQENLTPGGSDEYTVVDFSVTNISDATSQLPEKLITALMSNMAEAANFANPRDFVLQMGMGMRMGMSWNINGRTFEMEDVAREETVRLGDLEVWQFTNNGGMGMTLPHPMHIHGLQFQIVDRKVDPNFLSIWESVSSGFVDEGWHDTVLVMPGEQVRILMRFEDFKGLYLYHCHNLEHEDMGMMRNYRII
jgi:FtsP/CotA-like multicopper oxidase with cupredoxin domain